jgi:hypothetical protein
MHYGFESLGQLQYDWLDWVKQGSPPLSPESQSEATISVASMQRRPRPEPNLIYRGQSEDPPAAAPLVPVIPRPAAAQQPVQPAAINRPWPPAATPREPAQPIAAAASVAGASGMPPSAPAQGPGRVLLEWQRGPAAHDR